MRKTSILVAGVLSVLLVASGLASSASEPGILGLQWGDSPKALERFQEPTEGMGLFGIVCYEGKVPMRLGGILEAGRVSFCFIEDQL